MSVLGIIDFIIFIANILGVIGYFTELYVFTYIAVLLIIVIDIAYIILPFYRKPFIFTYLIGPAIGYIIFGSFEGGCLGIILLDLITFLARKLFYIIIELTRRGAKKNKVGSKYVCSKCGFEIKENVDVCPNCGGIFNK
jgi:hypothetical protein